VAQSPHKPISIQCSAPSARYTDRCPVWLYGSRSRPGTDLSQAPLGDPQSLGCAVNGVPVGGTFQTPRPKQDDGVSEVVVDFGTKFVFKVSGAVPSESDPEHFLHPGQCMSGICYGIGEVFARRLVEGMVVKNSNSKAIKISSLQYSLQHLVSVVPIAQGRYILVSSALVLIE
jgi:hypothetical protein